MSSSVATLQLLRIYQDSTGLAVADYLFCFSMDYEFNSYIPIYLCLVNQLTS